MAQQFARRLVLDTLLLCQLSVCLATETPDPNDSSKYLDAIRTFGDNVLKYGRDTYGPKHTPLFVDGLNIHTREPVKWIAPSGIPLIESPIHEGRIGHHIHAGRHDLIEYDWHRYLDFADKHWKDK